MARQSLVSTESLTYAGLFLALYLTAHLVARYTVPYADPYLLPMAALLSAIGVTMIYRLNPDDAFRQSLWIVIGVGLFAATLLALRRDYRIIERYKYLFGIGAIALLALPALPVIGKTINGARLWVEIGPLQFQPGELAKIMLIVFLAGYLRDKREVLAQGRIKDFGPLFLIWGVAMLVLLQTNDLGSALLQFGIFLAMLYVATGKASFAAAGSRPLRARRGGRVPRRRPRAAARDDLARALDERARLLRADGRAGAAPGLRLVPAREEPLLDRQRRLRRHRARQGHVHDDERRRDHPVPEHGLHLLGDRAGARARGGGGAAARVHALRRARDARRAAAPTTASRSCSPPGSRSASRCRRSSSSAGCCA